MNMKLFHYLMGKVGFFNNQIDTCRYLCNFAINEFYSYIFYNISLV